MTTLMIETGIPPESNRCRRLATELQPWFASAAMPSSASSIITILQAAVAPVILISGVGLLLLSMTNRYARVIDRARTLAREQGAGGADSVRRSLVEQAQVIWLRARLLRAAIVLAVLSIFGVALTVVAVFLDASIGVGHQLVAPIFLGSLLALVGSLGYLLRDVALSLRALRLELGGLADSRH